MEQSQHFLLHRDPELYELYSSAFDYFALRLEIRKADDLPMGAGKSVTRASSPVWLPTRLQAYTP